MKKATLLLCSIIVTITVFSQIPGITWQRSLSGPTIDLYLLTVKTPGNEIISVHSVFSSTGNLTFEKFTADGVRLWKKVYPGTYLIERALSYCYNSDGSLVTLFQTGTNLSYKYHVVKIDSEGNLLWEKFLGGTQADKAFSMTKSANGGYLIVGSSMSNNGDVTGNHGGTDMWLVKINEDGTILWQRSLGGSSDEAKIYYVKGKVVEISDGSIYMLGETASNDGDVTGNHGGTDIWLVKLNSAGDILWSKCFGGTSNETPIDFKLSPAGDLCILGYTSSPELTTNGIAQNDFYFARVSLAGDLLLQKTYGSTSGADRPSQLVSFGNDGSCVLSGHVYAGDGNVQNFHTPLPNMGLDTEDIWIFKIDQAGNIIWQRCLGGNRDDMTDKYAGIPRGDITGGIIQTSDGGYFISATTRSTDGDVIGIHSSPTVFPSFDLWIVKLSASGSTEWTQTLGGSSYEWAKWLPVELGPKEFIVGAIAGSNDGDVQQSFGSSDPWLLKLGAANTIKGTVFIDKNSNGIKEASEPYYTGAHINVSKGQTGWTLVSNEGRFSVTTDTGVYISTVVPHNPYYISASGPHTSTFTTWFNKDSFSFALQPVPGQQDLAITINPLTVARPGFTASYEIRYKNVGTATVFTGQILFKKDSRTQYYSSIPGISGATGDTLKWNYGQLDPGASGVIYLTLQLLPPPMLNNGYHITHVGIITPVAGDITPADDTASVVQTVQGSFDPNDKSENHGGRITPYQITSGEYLNYIIRFQNTGTDTAFNIVVRDTLDTKLDWSSFEMISSSHPYQLQIDSDNKFAWTFYDISLVDSFKNEPASHGYIAYRIKAKTGVGLGATIANKASIYFDFNLPVETNNVVTTVGNFISLPLHLLDFDANYHKPDALLRWSTADESNVDKFIIERGTDPVHFVPIGSVAAKGNSNSIANYQFKDGLASTSGDKFYYRLKMMDQDQKFTYSNIQVVKKEGRIFNELIMNPNPVKGRTGYAWINFERATTVELGVFDMQGRYRMIDKQAIGKGFNVVPVDFSSFSSGTYILQAKMDGKVLVSRFVLSL